MKVAGEDRGCAMRPLAWAIFIATLGVPEASWAQQVPDAAAEASRPKMDSAANGVPVVNIVAPNSNGVSHNKYQRFDVDKRGVILNNSAGIVRTQLGGYIAGNSHLKGGAASLILNEVSSKLPSNLHGYVEVGGKAAPVVIANPNGITCDGCGIINSQRFTLTSGRPQFGKGGDLSAYRVMGGSIAIGKGGLDGSMADRTDLIARAVQMNGEIWAKDLNVVAGSNEVDHVGEGARAHAGDTNRPAIAIDVAALGGMYADKIRLVGTEAGVGVVSSGVISAQAGDLTLTSAGEVRLGGTTVAKGHASIDVAGPVSIDGSLGTEEGAVSVEAHGPLTVDGRVISASSLAISSQGDIHLAGVVRGRGDVAVRSAAPLIHSGEVVSGGRLDLHATDITHRTEALISSGGDLSVNATGAMLNEGKLHAGGALAVDAQAMSIGDAASISASAALDLRVRDGLDSSGSIVAGGHLNVHSGGDLITRGNVSGRAVSLTSGATLIQGGTLEAETIVFDGVAVKNDGRTLSSGNVTVRGATVDVAGELAAGVTEDGTLGTTGDLRLLADTRLVAHGSLGAARWLEAQSKAIDFSLGKQRVGGDARLVAHDGDIDHDASTLVVDGSLTLQASGVLLNRYKDRRNGLIQARAVQIDAGSVDNFYGTIAGDRAVHIVTKRDLANDRGTITAQGEVALSARALRSSGTISGKSLGVTAVSGVNNDGVLETTAGDITLSAASLSNSGPIRSHTGAMTFRLTDGFDNGSEMITTKGGVTIYATRIANRGTISAGQLNVEATDSAENWSGFLQSSGDLHVRAGKRLDNHGSGIEANGATTVVAEVIANFGGRILNASNAPTRVIAMGGLRNSRGRVAGQGDLTIESAQVDNSGGTVHAGHTLHFVNPYASADNTGGTISAGHQLNLTLARLDSGRHGVDSIDGTGKVVAGVDGVPHVGNIQFDVRDFFDGDHIVANNLLSMHIYGDYIQPLGSSRKVAGGLSLAVDGQFVNHGSLHAGKGLSVRAANITNHGGASLDSADTQLNTGGAIANAGSIQGNTIGLRAGTVSNAGRVAGGNVTIQAGTVINGADFGQATDNAAYQSAIIAATQAVDIYADHLLNRDAQIFSLGNIHVAGAPRNAQGLFATRANQLDNRSGSIQAHGSILLAANQTNNHRRVANTRIHVLSASESAATSPLPSSGEKSGANRTGSWRKWTEYHTIEQTVLNGVSAPSQIVAGGDISLYGSVRNHASTISANGFLRVNQAGAGGGTGMIFGNEIVANESLVGSRTIQPVEVTQNNGCGWDVSLCRSHDPDYSTQRRPKTDPSSYIRDHQTLLGAAMTGSAGVAISGLNVFNGGVTPEGRPVAYTRLDPNYPALHDGSSGTVAVLPAGGIYRVRDGQGGTDGSAILAGAVERHASLMGHAYLTALLGHPPSNNYLIETDPRFTEYSQFISSEYLLDKLGLDPTHALKRLGDGFYEQQLVGQQVVELTGRTYLAGYNSELEQHQGLMNNAVQAAQAMDLRLGVALTAEQTGSLTHDMLWMVQRHVEGHDVLVPVVYLAGGKQGLVAEGAWVAAKDVRINVTGDLSNDGKVRGDDSTMLSAGNLLNRGSISSDGRTTLRASADIANINGRVDGADVSLVADGDIRSASVSSSDTDARAVLTATQNLHVGAGKDLVLADTKTTSDGDAQLAAGRDLTLTGEGASARDDLALTAGRDLTVGDVRNGTPTPAGPLTAGDSLTARADRDLAVHVGDLSAGGDLELRAGHDLSLTAGAKPTAHAVTHDITRVSVNGNLAVGAGNDAVLDATQVIAGARVSLQAGNDLHLTAVTDSRTVTASWKEGKKRITQTTTDETVHGVGVTAGSDIQIGAGHDATLSATKVATPGDIALTAGHDLTLGAEHEAHAVVTDTKKKTSSPFTGKKTTTHDTAEQVRAIGTTLRGDDIRLTTGNDLTTKGATVQAAGDIAAMAGHDVNLLATTDTYKETHTKNSTKSGLKSNPGGGIYHARKKTETYDDATQTVAHGTLLSGDSVAVGADRDLLGEAVKIVGTHDVQLNAGSDLHLTTAVETYRESRGKSVVTTGYSRNGVTEIHGDVGAVVDGYAEHVGHAGSLVGSIDGEVAVSAEKALRLTGSDVISENGVAIAAEKVTVDAATDTLATGQAKLRSTGGLTIGLGGKLYDLAMEARQSVIRARQTDDDRLKAVHAVKAAYATMDGVGVFTGSDTGGATDPATVSLQVGLGGSATSQNRETHDTAAHGSHIVSGGDVGIHATSGDLTIQASEVTGRNVALAASGDVKLLSQAEEHRLKGDASNDALGFGLSLGDDGLGLYASVDFGGARAHGNGSTHAETTVTAVDKASVASGGDTTIKGAQLKGQQVVADIGDNLTIRSEQDTDDYASKGMQAGGKIKIGLTNSGFVGGSAYYNRNKVDSDYVSVDEVSGIKAGEDGFQIEVGGTTHLAGGQIASTADPSKNRLDTGDLTWESLHNETKYDARQLDLSGGSTLSSNIAGAGRALVSLGTPGHDSDSSETEAGVAEGTIIVRNDPDKDLSGLDRQPTLDAKPLKNVYNAKKVAEQQELVAVAGYVGMRGAGDVAKYMQEHASTDAERAAWAEGGSNRVILHGLVGAATAALGEGNIAQGATGAAAGQAASQAMQDFLISKGVDPTSPTFHALMELGSAAAGGLAGGGEGARVAVQGDRFNRQLHPDETAMIEKRAADFARTLCNGCEPSQEQIEAATARLGQRAAGDLDILWKVLLPANEDPEAQAFLATIKGSFVNDLGQPQAMFTTERGQFFSASQNGYEANLPFIEKYVRPAATRDMATGLAEEAEGYAVRVGTAYKEDPLGFQVKVATGLLRDAQHAVANLGETLRGIKDGFVSNAQDIGDGASASIDPFLKERLRQLYGQDVSGAVTTITAIQAGVALGDAVGAGKLVGAGGKAAVKAAASTTKSADLLKTSSLLKPVDSVEVERVLATHASVGEEIDALTRIGSRPNGPDLTVRAPHSILNQQAVDDLAAGKLPGRGKVGDPRDMHETPNPNATAEDFAVKVLGRWPTNDELAKGRAMKFKGQPCTGCWVARSDDGSTFVTYRPSGFASEATRQSTATVEVNRSTVEAFNSGKPLKLKFPMLDH